MIKNKMGGKVQEIPNKVVAYEPDKTFAFRSEGTLTYTSTRSFEDTNGATRITEVMVGERPSGLLGLFGPLIMRFAGQFHYNSLVNLKRVLESQG